MNEYNGAPVSPFTGVPGWETFAEQEKLIELASQVPSNGTIVEIGAEFGMSASLFCKVAQPGVKIYSVDLFPGDLIHKHQANLARAGLGGRSKQITGDSARIGNAWQLGPIDLLFIDGDHSLAGVQRDIAAWIGHVKPGGVVVFHDAAPPTNKAPHYLHHEVQQGINDWLEGMAREFVYIEQPPVDTMRIFTKEQNRDYPKTA